MLDTNNMNTCDLLKHDQDFRVLLEKLMNFNINSDMLDINNIDSIINTCKKILVYKSIKDNNINIEDMSFICEAKNIIDC